MSVRQQLLTAEDLLEMPEVPGKRFELARGELVEMPGASYNHHAWLARLMMRLLDAFVVPRGLGEVFPDGLGYIVVRNPDSVRVPDASYISRDRLPKGRGWSYVPFAPDLAVEVVSPGDTAAEVRKKAREYLVEGGTRLVWVLWTEDRSVTVYSAGSAPQELGLQDTLDGGDVLPGFSVRVYDLFEDDLGNDETNKGGPDDR